MYGGKRPVLGYVRPVNGIENDKDRKILHVLGLKE